MVAVVTALIGTGFVAFNGDKGSAPVEARAQTADLRSDTASDISFSSTASLDRCRAARKGLRWYRGWWNHWTNKMDAGQGFRDRVIRSNGCPRYLAKVFRQKAYTARKRYEAWYVYHYHWWEWLPDNWQRLGACETGYGRRPGNWEHTNSRFTSAFGISWAVYNSDAAAGGAPPWHVRHTPRDQYNAALAHLRIYGDGWTCPGP